MDFSFLSKMGFSMDDIGKIAEIVMSGIEQGKGFIGNIPNPFAKK